VAKRVGLEQLDWFTPPGSNILDESMSPLNKWFSDGTLNLSYNCLDRHVAAGRGDQTAIAYHSTVGGQSRELTYAALLAEVSRLAGALSSDLGVYKGDRVVIYMPMIPEAIVAMLACARIGAVHSVVFGGFAPHELAVRIDDASPKALITATCGLEGAKGAIPYMPLVSRAVELAKHKPPHIVVKQRTEQAAVAGCPPYVPTPGRDVDYCDLVSDRREGVGCTPLSGADPLYSIYTSGTTGQPKGILRDQAWGVPLCWSMSALMRTGPGEAYFSTSDIGWAVGHSYVAYGPLLAGCTSVLYEGKPVGTPDAGEYWRIVEKYKVRGMFTAPTALRAIRRADPGGELLRGVDLSSLRTLFVAGERADPQTVQHFNRLLGVPVVDNYWQTESGWPMCGVQVDDVGTVPGSCGLPVPGYDVRVLDPATGEEKAPGGGEDGMGEIAVRLPLPPGFMATIYDDDQRFIDAYFSRFPGYYHAGDSGFKDANGYVHVMARTDDVMNVSGHRLSTGLLEETCALHPEVVECAVVAAKDELKGQVPVAMLLLKPPEAAEPPGEGRDARAERVGGEVVELVRQRVGAIACLKHALVVQGLPKTRSGKILRGTMRKIADSEPYKVPGTIEDESVLVGIAEALESVGYGKARGGGV